jgi:hypothetical protein
MAVAAPPMSTRCRFGSTRVSLDKSSSSSISVPIRLAAVRTRLSESRPVSFNVSAQSISSASLKPSIARSGCAQVVGHGVAERLEFAIRRFQFGRPIAQFALALLQESRGASRNRASTRAISSSPDRQRARFGRPCASRSAFRASVRARRLTPLASTSAAMTPPNTQATDPARNRKKVEACRSARLLAICRGQRDLSFLERDRQRSNLIQFAALRVRASISVIRCAPAGSRARQPLPAPPAHL